MMSHACVHEHRSVTMPVADSLMQNGPCTQDTRYDPFGIAELHNLVDKSKNALTKLLTVSPQVL